MQTFHSKTKPLFAILMWLILQPLGGPSIPKILCKRDFLEFVTIDMRDTKYVQNLHCAQKGNTSYLNFFIRGNFESSIKA